MDDLKELKSVLRSLVVSTPLQLTVTALLRDYRTTMGIPLPCAKYGYRDPLQFLKERCGDCFKFQGSGNNPILIPIVPEQLKHIDAFVRKQRLPSNNKYQGKRSSISESYVKPAPDLIAKTFTPTYNSLANQSYKTHTSPERNINPPSKAEAEVGRPAERDDKCEARSEWRSGSNEERHAEGSVRDFLRKRLPVYKSCDLAVCSEDDSLQVNTTSESSFSYSKHCDEEEKKPAWSGRPIVKSLSDAAPSAVRAAPPAVRAAPALVSAARREPPPPPADPDDALPYVDFDPDVFPADCMSFADSIPAASLGSLGPGDMVELMVGEVYSPSHFWFYRLGDRYHVALEDLMDEMTQYYNSPEGAARRLYAGAVRVGHYCSSEYERDWHRSLVVRVLDCDTVKVLHVDYGTVERVPARRLKPLLRRWAELPAQALRGRLACVRPVAGGRRWPHSAAAAFLALVHERPLVGNIVRTGDQETELILVDTTKERDVRLDEQLVRAGHADPAAAAARAAFSDCSVASASASEVAGRRAGRLSPWEPPPTASTPEPAPAPAPAPASGSLLERRLALQRRGRRDPTQLYRSQDAEVAEVAASYLLPRWEALESGATPNYADIHEYLRDGIVLDFVEEYRRHVPSALPPPPPPRPPPLPSLPRLRPPRRAPEPSPSPSPSPPPASPVAPATPDPAPTLDNRVPLLAPPAAPAVPAAGPGLGAEAAAAAAAGVTLSAAECAVFSLLSRVDPHAAHWYMVDAINRARQAAPGAGPPPPPPLPPPALLPPPLLLYPPPLLHPAYAPPPLLRPPPPPGFRFN